jgi:hypothetical protein
MPSGGDSGGGIGTGFDIFFDPGGILGGKGVGGIKDLLFGTPPNIDALTNLFNQLSQGQQQQYLKAQGFQNLGLQSLMKGYGAASKGIAAGASSSKMDANAVGQQAQAANQQSAINRGVYNTSTFDMGSRGISSDLARHLASIDAATQQAQGALDVSKANAIAGSYAGSAGLASNLSNQQASLFGPMAGAYGQLLQAQGQNHGLAGGILGAVGGILSDRRLKKNIRHVETVRSGLHIYEFEYTDSDALPGRYRGVMADEVEHMKGIVSVSPTGYKMVDYVALSKRTGIRFQKVGS